MDIYPVVPITQDEFNDWCRPWNYTLVIIVLGKRFTIYSLKGYLTRLWGIHDFELIDLPNNYFIVRFLDSELWRSHYRKVLYEGPWVIAQHCLLVQRWNPYFDPYKNQLGRIVTWVRIPDIPILYYNSHCISRIGDWIGKTLKVDMDTLSSRLDKDAKVARGRYAQICVELDLQKKLVPKIIASNQVFRVEYEGLNQICFECGRYGNRKEGCPWKQLWGLRWTREIMATRGHLRHRDRKCHRRWYTRRIRDTLVHGC